MVPFPRPWLSTVIHNYGDAFHGKPSTIPVIPAKAGIQDLWLPETPEAPELHARLGGHDTWELVLAGDQSTSP